MVYLKKHFKVIYPRERELKKTNVPNTKVSFIGVDLETEDSKF